jgi:hypothetical protein
VILPAFPRASVPAQVLHKALEESNEGAEAKFYGLNQVGEGNLRDQHGRAFPQLTRVVEGVEQCVVRPVGDRRVIRERNGGPVRTSFGIRIYGAKKVRAELRRSLSRLRTDVAVAFSTGDP